MRSWYVEVKISSNGQEAIYCLESHAANFFDVILLNIQMPVLGGCETTTKIRAKFKYPIIAMTEHDFDSVRDYCLTLGMNGHISKPFDRLILYPMLKFIFQKSGRIQP